MTHAALKKALKEALVETMREQPRLFTDTLIDAMEEVSLASAIREGETTRPVSRGQVMGALRSKRRRSRARNARS
jgi:hypothetical protein